MSNKTRLELIRESERKSHIAMYSDSELYKNEGWLKKPIKTVTEIFPYFESRVQLNVLDLGCGIGRNCIAIADQFRNIPCKIDCVDILDLAIEKLGDYAEEYGVSSSINGIVSSIDAFSISPNCYDWILAVSSLEHMDSKSSFAAKLTEIKNGLRKDGIACFVINSDIKEYDKLTHMPAMPQFEVNLSTSELRHLLEQIFVGWKILKSTQKEQRYEIPREDTMHSLQTTVVTFVAVKSE